MKLLVILKQQFQGIEELKASPEAKTYSRGELTWDDCATLLQGLYDYLHCAILLYTPHNTHGVH